MSYNTDKTMRFKRPSALFKPLIAIFILAITASFMPCHYAVAATLTVPDEIKTIHEAVEKAAPGDTVLVRPGKYNENILIRRPVAIVAKDGAKSTTITAEDANEPVIKATDVSGVTITGFTVTGSAIAGILLDNVSDSTVSGNAAIENDSGIIMKRSRNNNLSGNNADHNWFQGMLIDGSTGNVIEKNTANENSEKGITINNSHDNTIADNNANLNMWTGITVFASNKNIIKNNLTLRNSFGLVISDSYENIETNNTTVPNIFIIFPVLLVYIGIVSYLVQKNIFKSMARAK